MTRSEYNEFRYIRSTLNNYQKHGMILSYGTTLTIRTNASSEYKTKLDEFYTSLGFHPAGITTDSHRFDGQERIEYIFGLTFDLGGRPHPWTELYTKEEKARFAEALK